MNERALIDHAQVTQARLYGSSGTDGEYRYIENGKRGIRVETVWKGHAEGAAMAEYVEVEYLAEKPEVKRVKGTGSSFLLLASS